MIVIPNEPNQPKRDSLCVECVKGVRTHVIFDAFGKTSELRQERCTACYGTGWIGPRHKEPKAAH